MNMRKKECVTVSIEKNLLAKARGMAGLIPFSRYVEGLLREATKEPTTDKEVVE